MSLRVRIIGAFVLLVAVAVGVGTAAHLAEVSRQLEASLRRQAARVVDALQAELAITQKALDSELDALQTSGRLDRWLSVTGAARYAQAKGRLAQGRVDVIKLLGPRGDILLSGHWPSSFGALDPLLQRYQGEQPEAAVLVGEATPLGNAPTLERWRSLRRGRSQLTLVVGRFLDLDALERLRATVGADVLALCRSAQGPSSSFSDKTVTQLTDCVHATDDARMADVGFTPGQEPLWRDRFFLTPIQLLGSDDFSLVAGLSRQDLDEVKAGIVRRALFVGFASAVLAMLFGLLLATRITRPVEALVQAAEEVADGNLSVRVPVRPGEGGPEVSRLVDAFEQMAADIDQSQRELRQAERVAAWREIARGLAHELKNPLTPIRGAMDVIRRAHRLGREDFDAILEEQAGAVVEEVERLKELSDAFARFARLPDPSPEPVSVSAVLDNAVALYAGEETRVSIERNYVGDGVVQADRTQMATALTNLIKNAVEAMDGAGTLWLSTRPFSVEGEDGVQLAIEDSGSGISDEVRERLFTPYFTTKGSRGTGLGLALVHRIVVEHGGRISVDNGREGGARFLVWWPKGKVEA